MLQQMLWNVELAAKFLLSATPFQGEDTESCWANIKWKLHIWPQDCKDWANKIMSDSFRCDSSKHLKVTKCWNGNSNKYSSTSLHIFQGVIFLLAVSCYSGIKVHIPKSPSYQEAYFSLVELVLALWAIIIEHEV